MSTWIEIKKPEDVEVYDDGTMNVLYSTDRNGNNYIEIPLEFVINAINIHKLKEKS